MSGIKRDTKTRKFGSRDQHKRTEEDNTYSFLEIMRGDCEFEKKELEEELEKDEPIWKVEKIIAELTATLQANGLPSDPYKRYCSEDFNTPRYPWDLQTQVESMTESYLCRESASALLLAVMLKHRILDEVFDDTSTNYALDLALIMPRLKMLEMEHEAAAGKKRMDGVKRANEENRKQKEKWNEIACEEFKVLSKKGALSNEEIYRKICRKLRSEGINKEPGTIKKAIIKSQKTEK